jgi:O-antigen/teichoic acid export membrane protein
MSLAQTVVKNASAGVAAQLAIKLLSFGFTVLVVRQLGAEQFGQYAAVLAFGAMFVFLADLGLGVFVVREVSRWRTQADGAPQIAAIFADSLALRLVLSCIAAILLMLTAIATDRPVPMLVALAIGAVGLIVFSINGACESVLSGFERLDVEAVARVANQLTFVMLGTLALWIGAGYHGLAVATLVGAIVMTGICLRATRGLGVVLSRPTPARWLGLLRASAPFAVIAGTLGLSYKFDSVLLNVTRGDAETGYYNAAYSLVFASAFLSNAVNTALYPSMTRQFARDPASLPGICATALRYLMVLAVPVAVGGWALSDKLVTFLFGEAYGPAATALAILIWVVPLMFTSELLGYVVVVRGQEGRVARAVLVSTGVNVGCNLLLVPWFGLVAAAAMTVVTEAVLVSQYLWALRSLLASIAWGRTLGRTLVAALVMGGLALLLRNLPVAATVVLAGLAYGLLLLGLGVVGRDDLNVLSSMRRRPESGAPDPTKSEPRTAAASASIRFQEARLDARPS